MRTSFRTSSLFSSGNSLSQRRFMSEKAKNIPVVTCSQETLLDGKGIGFLPTKRTDKFAYVGLVKPPKGHVESKDEAVRGGFVNFFHKKTTNNSMYTIGFNDSNPVQNTPLDHYMETRKSSFFDRFPDGQVAEVSLDKTVTEHLNHENISHKALFFGVGPSRDTLHKIVLFVKTPGGFWDLSWHSDSKTFNDPTQYQGFAEVIKDFKVIMKDEPDTVAPIEQEEMVVLKKKIIE
eukprot:TRINITY_DN315_c0_g1_i1.p1 TRINITY_DN315_c0_g1~~TRINITY_DN315_c0_g1_i1.p1  ORF type:complete len:234 (-),score=61.44 TRINITY_DN315_c0_g1_i1:156-857(-)